MSFSQTGGGTTTYQQTVAINQLLAQTGMPWFAKSGKLTPGILMTALDLRTSLGHASSFTDVEARRIAQILKMSEAYPHSFTYLNNPFTEAGEFAGIALREATLHSLIQGNTVGIMSTRSRVFLEDMKSHPELSKIFLDNFRVRNFDPERDSDHLLPDVYYNLLKAKGLPSEVTEGAQIIYDRLVRTYVNED